MRRLRTVQELIWVPFYFESVFKASLVLRGSFSLCLNEHRLWSVFFSYDHTSLRQKPIKVSCFNLMTRLPIAEFTPTTAAIPLYIRLSNGNLSNLGAPVQNILDATVPD